MQKPFLVYWLQAGKMHTRADCRKIEGGESFSRIVLSRSAVAKAKQSTGNTWCETCGADDPAEADTRTSDELHEADTVRIPIGASEEVKVAALKAPEPKLPKPEPKLPKEPDCTCGHPFVSHADSGWNICNWCMEYLTDGEGQCPCINYTPVELPVDVECRCGCPESCHREPPGYDGKWRWCEVTGCGCSNFYPKGKLTLPRGPSRMIPSKPEPPVELPPVVEFVSPVPWEPTEKEAA